MDCKKTLLVFVLSRFSIYASSESSDPIQFFIKMAIPKAFEITFM